MKIILITIISVIVYLLLLEGWSVKVSNKDKEYKVECNGLLWASLDRLTIWRYSSTDKPMDWIKFTKITKSSSEDKSQ